MKPAGFHLLIFVVAVPLAAQEPAESSPGRKTSARLTQEIRVTLPNFIPPPPPVLDRPKGDTSGDDPNVLVLPKFTVKEKRPPTHDPDAWLTDRAIQQKAMAAYKQSLTDLEWALNSWYIPLFGSSPSARARGSYEYQKKMSELRGAHRLFKVISTTDPRAGDDLEKERVKMDQAEYWQSRPAGDGRKK
jgi:hypothetical protein